VGQPQQEARQVAFFSKIYKKAAQFVFCAQRRYWIELEKTFRSIPIFLQNFKTGMAYFLKPAKKRDRAGEYFRAVPLILRVVHHCTGIVVFFEG
jgi:hypothetical protein